MTKFLSDIILSVANDIQFQTTAGTNAGKISQVGDDLVLSNAVGDILLGNGSDDIFIGDGTNTVDIRFEQNMAIFADSSSTRTLTLGGNNTNLVLESPTLNSATFGATTINNTLTFTGSTSFIVFDYEPANDTGEYTSEVPLLKVDKNGTPRTILSRTSENGALMIGHDDTVALTAGDTRSKVKDNWGMTNEHVVLSAEGGYYAFGWPNNMQNDTNTNGVNFSEWSDRYEFRFRTDAYSRGNSTTETTNYSQANNGLYIGSGGSTQFIDMNRNLKNIGTISSGAITSSSTISSGAITSSSTITATQLTTASQGDISTGTSYQQGTVSAAQPVMRSSLLAHSPESNESIIHPYFFNDLANFVARGGTVTYGGLSADPTSDETARMFEPSARTANASQAEITGSTWSIELTDLPRSLNYGTRIGISFGSPSFSPSSMLIEYSTDNGTSYTTALNSSVSNEYYHTYVANGATAVNAIKFTLGKLSGNNGPRVMNIYAYNYDSRGMSEYFVDKGGDTLYGNLSVGSNSLTAGSLDINGAADISGNLTLSGGALIGDANWDIYAEYTNRGRINLLSNNSADTNVQVALLTNGNQRLTIDKGGTVTIGGTVVATTFSGDLNGTINTSTTATTQSASDNSTKVATTAYVDAQVATIVDSAPGTLNTLNELAAALGDDASFSTTVTNSIATKLPLAGGTMTGDLTISSTAPNLILEDTNGRSIEMDINGNTFRIDDVGNNAAIFTSDLSTNPVQTTFGGPLSAGSYSLTGGSLDINGNADISGSLTLGQALAVGDGGTGVTSNTIWLNANAFANFASSSADWDTVTTRGLYRLTGATNNPFGSSHSTGFTLTQGSGDYGFQLFSKGSGDNSTGIAYRYRGTSWENWQYLVTKTYGDGRYLLDSEVTNLAQVKAFDSSDYATAAQGTLATNALPKSGGTMSGAIAMGNNNITGVNNIQANGNVSLQTSTGEYALYANANGQTALYTDGIKKFETMTTGATVFSTTATFLIEGDGVTSSNLKFKTNTVDRWNVNVPSGQTNLAFTTGSTNVLSLDTSNNATFAGEVTATEYNLPSGGMLDWANGDARIVEGETNNYSLTFKTYDGANCTAALRLDGDNTATFTGSIAVSGTVDGVDIATRDGVLTSTTTTANAALPKTGGTMTGAITLPASNPTNANHATRKAYVDAQVLARKESFILACSDETTDLTASSSVAKVTFRMPYAFTLTDVRATVNTAPVGSTIIVDVKKGGSTIFSTKVSIDANAKSSFEATSARVFAAAASEVEFNEDEEVTVFLDQIGSSTAGKGLKVMLIGQQ